MKKLKNLFILSLLLMISSLSFSQTTYTPKRYWTFNTSTPGADSTGNRVMDFTTYNCQYTILNDGPVKKYIDLGLNSNLISGGNISLNQGVTIEFLMKPGRDFEQSKLFQRQDGAFYISFEYPKIVFQTNTGGLYDEFIVNLNGIGKKSYNYYVDGNWHHIVFKYNATTGSKQIWIDGQLPDGFSKSISSSSFNNSTSNIFFGSTVNYVRYYGALDECAIYDVAIPDKLIYKHYLNFQQGQSYSYVDDYSGTIPNPSPVSAGIDLQEFAPGHVVGQLTNGVSSGVSILPTTQLLRFPDPRYKPNHTLKRNFNWMDEDYMAGQFQNWNTSNNQTAIYGTELQSELAKNFNYYFNIRFQSNDPRFTVARDYLNNNVNIPISMRIFRAQLNGNSPDLTSQSKPNSYYLQNSSGQFLNTSGGVISSGKIWRPTAPANGYTSDGNIILNSLNGLTTLNRNIAIINENAEIFPIISSTALSLDPAVVSDKNATGLNWDDYLGLRIKDNETQSYRNIFMNHPKVSGGLFTEYLIDGHPVYNKEYKYRRLINYPINEQYYSTGDFYVRWPSNWRYWTSAWHGWQWFVESRHIELGLGDKFYSPFICAGWDANEEINVRPSQWLGLLKNHTAFGAEFFYAGFFNLSAPWPDSRNWIWQSVTPSYAQALVSKVETLFKNSNVMPGDEPDSRISPINPGYQFRTGDKSKLVVIRKHNSQNEYYITASINPYSNMAGAAPNVSSATILLDGNNITFNVRRQGSVYVYNSTTNVFYQLDGWHQVGHPYYWSTNFELEGELADKGNITIRTEPVVNKNYTNFVSHITFTDTISYRINVRETGNYSVYVKAKNLINNTNSELKVVLNTNSPKIIGCINDTTWKWYTKEKSSGANITFNNLPVGIHTLYFITNNNNLAIDKILFTKNIEPVSPLVTTTCNTTPIATISAGGLTNFCQGGNVTLTASSGNSYLWSNGATTQSIIVSTSGNYSCTITTAGIPSTSNIINITVNTLPIAVITAGGSTTICAGETIDLTASAAASYLWSNGETTQNITTSTPGNYIVTVTSANGCTNTSSPIELFASNLQTPTITTNGSTSLCAGQSITLTCSAASSYLWNTGANTQSIIVNSAGNYFVKVTDVNGCIATSTTVIISVNTLPLAKINVIGGTTICEGQTTTLSSDVNNQYLWSTGEVSQSIVVGTSGTYGLTVTNQFGCSATSIPVTITVNPRQAVLITPAGPITLCNGQSSTLTASGGNTYLWSNGDTTSTITVNATGNYFVTATNMDGCTMQSLPVSVTVNSCNTCTVPTNLVNSNITSTSATISWTPVANASKGYTVRLRNMSTTQIIYFNIPAGITSKILTLNPNTKYRWSVKAKCGTSNSTYATNQRFKTLVNSSRTITEEITEKPIVPNCKIDDFDLYPNPANTSVSMCFKSPVKSKVKILFYNKAGQISKSHEMNSDLNINTITLNIDDLAPGLYNVKIISDSFIYSKQLTVIKL